MVYGRMGVALIAVLLHVQLMAAESQVFSSPVKQTGLLELYTSEGCSSCPPADKWVSSLKDNPDLWNQLIPLAFHVDYWDYIGWQDRFAMPEYTARQRQFARQQSLRTVYTPGFIYNGREWRNWFARRFFDFPEGNKPGVLTVRVADDIAELRFKPTAVHEHPLFYNVALVGFGLDSTVNAGENNGRTLHHDFVVLNTRRGSLSRQGDSYTAMAQVPDSDVKAERYAVVTWIHSGNDLTPIQATGGYLSQ